MRVTLMSVMVLVLLALAAVYVASYALDHWVLTR